MWKHKILPIYDILNENFNTTASAWKNGQQQHQQQQYSNPRKQKTGYHPWSQGDRDILCCIKRRLNGNFEVHLISLLLNCILTFFLAPV